MADPIRSTIDRYYSATYRLQTRRSPDFYNHPLMDRQLAFGKRIRTVREIRGLSQEELADLAHLHRTYIGGVERGERNVSLVSIWRIADALGVDPSVLFANAAESSARDFDRSQGGSSSGDLMTQRDKRWTKKQKR